MSVVALFKLTMLICIHLTIATDCPNPKSPFNGYVYGSFVKTGSTALYRCKPNHKLIGENINICGRNGEWEKPIPVCFPVCEEPIFRPNRMHYLTSDIQIGDLKIVTKANFLCHDGYILTGEESLKCDNGIWNTKEPQCVKSCKNLGEPVNGFAQITIDERFLPNYIASYACDMGYKLNGAKIRKCSNGSWSGKMPKCEFAEGIKCDEPEVPIDGSKVGDPPYTIGSSVEFTCNNNSGILIGAERIVCDSYGRWSDETPLCILVSEKQLTCKTTADEVLDARSKTAVRVNCPGNCLQSEAPVYGTMIYKTSSSICRAAIHGGVIGKDINHCISAIIRNNGQYANFRSSEKNGIVSRRDVKIQAPSFVFVTNGNQRRRDPSGCGISSAPSPSFIVNGNASGIDEWPWQAVIARSRRQKQIFSPICGGSLLNEDWVLTAAQCVTFLGRKDVLPISMSRIYLGKYYRDDEKDDKYVQVAEVGEIHVHTDYEPKTYDADIAMIKLKNPIKFTKRVRPVCLPTFQSTSENLVEFTEKFGVVTGWGRADDFQFTSTLKQARIPVVSSSVCVEGYKSAGIPITMTDNMFCADYKEGRKDACSGNSGSPMVFQQSSTKKWTIEGILSWGSPNGCGLKNQYSGFVIIHRFLDWINEFL